jgi:hypothetical protein
VSGIRIGLDARDDAARVARVDCDAELPNITALGTFPRGEMIPPSLLADSLPSISVPDEKSITRIIQLPPIDPALAESAARFELSTGLLDASAGFKLSVITLGATSGNGGTGSRWLGMAVRQTLVDRMVAQWLSEDGGHISVRFTTRAVALGRGYLHFCEPVSDGLVLVMDLSASGVSICFVQGGALVGTACLRGLSDVSDGRRISEWVSELQTLVNFRLATDLSANGAESLSAIVLAGERSDAHDVLREHFTVPVLAAEPKPTYRTPDDGSSGITASWLVALGLTVGGGSV